jgi:SAM-dependent methyltransferase
MSASAGHWQAVYRDRPAAETSWFRPHLDQSLRLVDGLVLPADTPVIDVGGGRSTLVDDLLGRGYTDVTVLDVAPAALDDARHRLGAAGAAVTWLVGDITRLDIPAARFALWHDRAVFHFMVEQPDRDAYIRAAAHSVAPGGHAIIAGFASDGPARCSGLPVRRHDAAELAAAFAPAFALVEHAREIHPTPTGAGQAFTYVLLQRREPDPTDT